jgi:uncharacterized membrane protein
MFADKSMSARAGRLATLVSALALIASATVADAKERDKDKKKGGNIKRTSGHMMGGPGPGGNPGNSNLNAMWKRGQ